MKPEALLYKAQTIGNIEPIEYMIPYPSTQALIEGKTLKFGDQIIYEDYKITNIDFYKLVQKTANWLNDKGIQPKENVLIEDIGSPHTFLLLYGIWHLGARATLIDDSNNRVNNKQVVVLISTVLPGTIRREFAPIMTNVKLIYNPYLIAMGTVAEDMINPEIRELMGL